VLGPYKLPAIVTGGDLTLSGSVSIIAGDNGGVHANGDLDINGSGLITGIDPETGLPALENGTVTASGSYDDSVSTVVTNPDASGGGYADKNLPNVDASFYRSWADYVLESTGQLTCNRTGGCTIGATPYAYGGTICNAASNPHNQCSDNFGWIYDDGTPAWRLMATGKTNPTYGEATFYAETLVELQQAGSVADPLNLTILAEGSIDVSGNVVLTPDSTELLFVTDGDLQITGNLNMPLAEGQMLVHEQVRISSSAAVILGQLVIEDAEEIDDLVTGASSIQGATITYTGDVGNTLFYIGGWREVR